MADYRDQQSSAYPTIRPPKRRSFAYHAQNQPLSGGTGTHPASPSVHKPSALAQSLMAPQQTAPTPAALTVPQMTMTDGGAAGTGTPPAAGAPASGGAAADFYNAIMGRLGETEFFGAGNRPARSLFEQNQAKLVGEIIPAMMASGWSNNMPAFTSNNPWYGGYLLASALTGTPYYNPDMDKEIGVLQSIPGYAPHSPGTLAKGAHPGYSYYWMG